MGYPILGRNVYTYDEKSIEATYDSWYIDKLDTEDFVHEGRKKALNADDYLYSVIFEIE